MVRLLPSESPPMLALLRRFLNTWAARVFFIVLLASFGLWGISGTIRDLTHDTALATVGDTKIEPGAFQDAFRQQLSQVSKMLGGKVDPTPQVRQAVAGQVLDRLITQAAVSGETKRLGIMVPDAAVKQAVFDMPAFKGRGGSFDKDLFNQVMRQNNLTENRFLDLMRTDLAQRQLLEAVEAGVAPPDVLTRAIFAFQRESRTAAYVEFAFAAAPAPPAPDTATLQRFYENNPGLYSAPEFRRVKVVVLSPDTVAREIEVNDQDIAASYAAHRAEYVQPEKRSAEIVISQDEAVAKDIAAAWQGGADWDAVQKQANDAGASAASLDDSTAQEFPATELAQAVFGAAADVVTGPVKSGLGWQVFRVTKVTAAPSQTLADARDGIRTRLARERAADLVYSRVNTLEDALSTDPTLEHVAADIGAEAAMGELDAQGMTRTGEPAPLPGSDALRPLLLTSAFALSKGEPPRLTEGPDGAYYAMAVEDTEAPQVKPYADVAGRVAEDWEHESRRHTQDIAAAGLFAAVKDGQKLEDAALKAGLRMERTAPLARGAPADGLAQALAEPVFKLHPGEPTMVETPDGFLVAELADISSPDPAADPAGYAQLRQGLTQAMAQDAVTAFAGAVRVRLKPTVNRTMLNSFSQ